MHAHFGHGVSFKNLAIQPKIVGHLLGLLGEVAGVADIGWGVAEIAGAVDASRHRLALMREFERDTELTVHQLIAELHADVDWLLIEGFRGSDLHKIEVWRAETGHPALYPDDEFVVAIATDDASRLPEPTRRAVLDLNRPSAVADWLLEQGARFEYVAERYGA